MSDEVKSTCCNAEVIEGVLRNIDRTESDDDNKSMEQWKQYKRIRNNIRDEYNTTN